MNIDNKGYGKPGKNNSASKAVVGVDIKSGVKYFYDTAVDAVIVNPL